MAASDSNNFLHEAAREGNVEAVRQHLIADAETLNARDRLSRTPLHLAAWAGQADVVRVLCDASADVGAAALDDMAAIHFASQKGHTEVVRILLASGAYVNAKNRKGMTPLHFAVHGKREDLTKLLIGKGANLSTENKAGKKPIDLVRDQSFRAVIRDAELERNARRAKSNKEKQSSGREKTVGLEKQGEEAAMVGVITVPERPVAVGLERQRDEVKAITLPEIPVTVTGPQNEEGINNKSHSRDDVEQKTEVEVVTKRAGEGNHLSDSSEPRSKKAKVSLLHLSFSNEDEDEIDTS